LLSDYEYTEYSLTTCLFAALTACIDGRKPRLLLLDAVVRGNDDLYALLARRTGCDVIRSRDVTSSSDCMGDVAGVVLVHSPFARQLYDASCRGLSSSSSVDVFTTVVSELVSQWHRDGRDTASPTPVYHICYVDNNHLDVNSQIIQ